MIDRYESSPGTYASLHGTVISTSMEGDFTEEVWYESPDMWRAELSGELNDLGSLKAGHVRVTNGLEHYLIWEPGREFCHPSREEVASSTLVARIDDQIFGFPGKLDLSASTVVSQETIAGRPAIKILLDPELPGGYIWLDATFGVVLAFDRDLETSTIRHSEFKTISFNENLDDDLFQPGIPGGFVERPCEEVVNY